MATVKNEASPLVSVNKTNVRTQVFEQLRDQIIKGAWPPGTKIPSENELTRQLGVSRISIREALQKLVALEILETRQGEGTYVRSMSASIYMSSHYPVLILNRHDLMEILEYRKIMEVGAVEMAVERATEEDLKTLEEIIHKMEEDSDDEKQFAVDDLEFHLTIAKATKNQVIIRVNNIIRDILNVSRKDIVHNLGMHDGLYYHRKILDALKKRDRQKAMALMEEHVLKTITRIKAYKSKKGKNEGENLE